MKQNKETLKKYFETGDKPTQQQYAELIDSYVDSKQPEGKANRRFVIDETGEVNIAEEERTPEYTLSDIVNNKLSLLKDGITVKEIDLTPYVDDTNLARLVSGTVDNNGVATFTRDDNSTFTVDLSNLKGGGAVDVSNLVPYTGATQDVDLGNYSINSNKEEIIASHSKYYIPFTVNDKILFRRQTGVWTGGNLVNAFGMGIGFNALSRNKGVESYAFGDNALLNNLGAQSCAFGHQALENNIGIFSSAFGYQALQGNTKGHSSAFGYQSLRNNTGLNSVGFGGQSLAGNSGNYSTAVGFSTLSFNSGGQSTALGFQSGYRNSGNDLIAIGYGSAENNSGSNNISIGNRAMKSTPGSYNLAIGHEALFYSKNGESNVAIGHNAMNKSQGIGNSMIGFQSGFWSMGEGNVSLGSETMRYSSSFNKLNSAIGYKAWYAYNQDDNNIKTIASNSSDIDAVNNRITLTSHGLGSANKYVNLKYVKAGGTGSIGLNNSSIYLFKIVDSNTIESELLSLSVDESGTTHTFIPEKRITNSTAIGANSLPTKSNQIVLGDSNVQEVFTKGDYITATAGKGLVLTTPDNTKQYRLSIDNAGSLAITLI
ncbi:hypothetical protein [uncultured Tenacibaculum sp.]|uniref:hypothetical protein n=1 Tax=uncultured Tenacibaculum sp. TaxID=174713 RepID=UPI002624A117|nr:hypothetical protein [uncultured Tenacibaculum sp.]